MKVLFVSSNPEDESTLDLNREITELQRGIGRRSPTPVRFEFMPGLAVEKIRREFSNSKPDILHLSAHGEKDELCMFSTSGTSVKVNASRLLSWFDKDHPPKLVYLNACDSHSIAEELAQKGIVAIGHTVAISNRLARDGAVEFYSVILDGYSAKDAFEAAKDVIEIAGTEEESTRIFAPQDIDLAKLVFHNVPRLVAKLETPYATLARRKFFRAHVGITNCPPSVNQVLFFTDDDSDDISTHVTLLRRKGRDTTLWAPSKEGKKISRNLRLYGVGATYEHQTFVVSSSICDAIELYYRLNPSETMPQNTKELLRKLKMEK
jgi:hypothetical protein